MPAGDPAGYLPNVKRYRARKARGLGAAIKTAVGPAKGANRAAGLRTDKARVFSGLGPRKGVQRMEPNGLRQIGPYKGPVGAGKPTYAPRKKRAIR